MFPDFTVPHKCMSPALFLLILFLGKEHACLNSDFLKKFNTNNTLKLKKKFIFHKPNKCLNSFLFSYSIEN